jgi:hypothetical protein
MDESVSDSEWIKTDIHKRILLQGHRNARVTGFNLRPAMTASYVITGLPDSGWINFYYRLYVQ